MKNKKKMDSISSNLCSLIIPFLYMEEIKNCKLLNKHWNKILGKENENFWRLALLNLEIDPIVKRILEKHHKKEINSFEKFEILRGYKNLR